MEEEYNYESNIVGDIRYKCGFEKKRLNQILCQIIVNLEFNYMKLQNKENF